MILCADGASFFEKKNHIGDHLFDHLLTTMPLLLLLLLLLLMRERDIASVGYKALRDGRAGCNVVVVMFLEVALEWS